jgi:hypothetical protein
LVATTDRVFTFATAEGRLADLLRTRVAPFLFPRLTAFESAREWLFRTVSQITLNYRDGPLSQGAAGGVHGGDRLPWVDIDGASNYDTLIAIRWQVHVYGTASGALASWCRDHDVPLTVVPWHAKHEAAGLTRDALYLLRPDTYVALAHASGAPSHIESYFTDRGIKIGAPAPEAQLRSAHLA